MYRIRVSSEAKKQLKKLKILHKSAIGMIIEDLKENPFLGKPLSRELIQRFSYRVGVYRVVYKVNEKDKIIDILNVGDRSTIYN